jgi:hypothetical protein
MSEEELKSCAAELTDVDVKTNVVVAHRHIEKINTGAYAYPIKADCMVL